MTSDRFDVVAEHVLFQLSLCKVAEDQRIIIAAALRVAYEIGLEEGRSAGLADVGEYARAIGRIEAALGYAGARPLAQTAQAVEDALRVLRRLNSDSSGRDDG